MDKLSKPTKDSHLENIDLDRARGQDKIALENADINDVKENKRLNRRLDLRVLPLCCWVYLLNFLDRGLSPSKIISDINVLMVMQVISVMLEYST
jgi:hypothetical protein